MTSFRAAYIAPAQSTGINLTTPEQSHLSDVALIDAAIAEGHNAGLIGAEEFQMSEQDFRDAIVIGTWMEG